MKIVGLGNCKNLRKYVDEIALKTIRKGQSNYYYNMVRRTIFFEVKYKIIHEDYSLIKPEGKDMSELVRVINIIMENYCKYYLRKEKVKKIQYKLRNKGHKETNQYDGKNRK